MQFLSQKFVSENFEGQFQKYIRKFRLRFQQVQKVILLPLILFYTIEKVFESSWFVVSLNIILGLIVVISLKYEKKCIRLYEILMMLAILLFNAFYSVSQYLNIHPERYQFIDGYFLAILSLTIINMMDTMLKAILLITIYIFFLVIIPNPQEPIWQQIIKFTLYIVLYCQQQRYQQRLLRMTYLQYCKHLTIENSIKNNMEMKYYIVNFIESQRCIVLQQEKYNEYTIEEEQIEFQTFLRNVIVTNCGTDIKKQIRISKRNLDMNLEQFLFYLFTDKKKLKELENYELKYLDHEHFLFGFTMEETYSIRIIKCFDEDPCAILLVTEHQKEQYVNKLKLQNKAQLKMFNYFSDIFNSQIRVSLVFLKWLKENQQFIKNNLIKQEQYLNYAISKLYVALNNFYNIQDYFLANSDFQKNTLSQFDLLKTIKVVQRNTKYFQKLNKLHPFTFNIQSSSRELMMNSDNKKVTQLFLNLLIFSTQYSQNITIEAEEDFDTSDPPQPIINIQLLLQNLKGQRIDTTQFPIINPQTIEELKLNDKKDLNLNISISILIIRNLGPFNKMTFRYIGKSLYKIQFYLYKYMNQNCQLMPVQSFNPKDYIEKNDEWQLTQSYLKNQSINLVNLSPETRLETQRCVKFPLSILQA